MALIFIAHKYTNVGLTISQYYLKVKTVDTGELIKKGFRLEMGKIASRIHSMNLTLVDQMLP
jgi:hypothetical protein